MRRRGRSAQWRDRTSEPVRWTCFFCACKIRMWTPTNCIGCHEALHDHRTVTDRLWSGDEAAAGRSWPRAPFGSASFAYE